MKWAKTTSECNKIRKTLMKEEMNYYDEIADQPTLEDLKEKGFGVWLEVTNKKLPKHYTTDKPSIARARYELFVGGFLYFFEKHVSRRRKDDRLLYFDWGKINKKVPLTIYLSPLYIKVRKKITDTGGSDGNGNGNGGGGSNGNGKHYPQQNGGNLIDVWEKQGMQMQKTAIASPPATDTDPPPPPPPPPPPRE